MNYPQIIKAYIHEELSEDASKLFDLFVKKYPEESLTKTIRRIYQFTEDVQRFELDRYDEDIIELTENDEAVENLSNAILPLVHGYLVLSVRGETKNRPADDVSFLNFHHDEDDVYIALATNKLAHAVCISCLDHLTSNYDGTFTFRLSAIYDMDWEQFEEVHCFGDFKL